MPSKAKSKTSRVPTAPVAKEIPLIGHQEVLAHLRVAMNKGRLGHAFLFVGQAGIGKKRFARHFAQSLLCEVASPEQLHPCGQCAPCALVRGRTHPDLIEVDRPADKSEIPIALIQELSGQLSLKPAFGKRKVAILNDADDLNEESANAFLKTLEEPPAGSVLILIARTQESQLPTIQSRCQVLRFRPLTVDEVARVLVGLAWGDETDARAVAQSSQGSVAQAIEWSQPEWRELTATIENAFAQRPVESTRLAARLNEFIEDAGKESALKRTRARLVVQRVADLFAESLRQECGPSFGSSSGASNPFSFDPDLLGDMIDRTLDADYHIQRMASLPLIIETWLDDLGRLLENKPIARIY